MTEPASSFESLSWRLQADRKLSPLNATMFDLERKLVFYNKNTPALFTTIKGRREAEHLRATIRASKNIKTSRNTVDLGNMIIGIAIVLFLIYLIV